MPDKEELYNLRVSDDRLAVLLDCQIEEGGIDRSVDQILGGLKGLSVAAVPSREDLEQLVVAATAEGPEIAGLVLVQGRAPILPLEAKIEWAGEFFSPGFAIDDDTGQADYWQRRAQPAVREGELLATVTPPKEGEDGEDVFGKCIPAPRARPPRIRGGLGVRVDDTGYRYYASTNGRVRYIGGTLSVDQIYSVPGSVGLTTGNIYHPGALVIEKDIEAGSQVKADGDISVGGMLDSADIEAGGSLEIQGGLTGVGRKPIKVAGRIQARFILDAQVSAGQDIMVASEIVHSQVTTQGAICMPKGRLVGGEVYARKAIDVKQVGTEAAVPTRLTAGLIGETAKAMAEKEKEIDALQEQAQRIRKTIEPLLARAEALSHGKREILTQLMDKLSDIEGRVRELEEELEAMHGGGRPQIIVRGTIFPETVFTIGYATQRIREALSGPIRVVASRSRIHLQPWGGR
ncbi:MAG: DUF342 domain-containing protein [Candidatus Hydrogenedentes bacterium]|nr:DUF342 domain-containing protein [Candidatus Hydrogenedentota bacterium]